jgi:hypothetical protein
MFNNDQASSAFWFCFGLIVIFSSLPYGLGEIRSPDTGFMPFLTGMAMCILAIIGFFEATMERRKGVTWQDCFTGVRWHKPLMSLSSLVVYALFLEKVGFLIASTLLVGFLLRVIHPQKWSVVVIGSLLASSVMYVVFHVWLKTQLPSGLLGF